MRKRKVVLLMGLDIIALNISYLLALLIRFEGQVPNLFLKISFSNLIIITIIKIGIYYLLKLYSSIWEYASVSELVEICGATLLGNLVSAIYITLSGITFSYSIMAIVSFLDILFIGGIRFLLRGTRLLQYRFTKRKGLKKVLIVGAGAAGAMTLKEFKRHRTLYSDPVGFIDDDPKKVGKGINGVPILGNHKDIYKICQKKNIDEIIIAIPSAKGSEIKKIINECKKTSCKTKILPGFYELIDGKVSVSKIRNVEIEDLLGRKEIHLDLQQLSKFIEGKIIMVTGGGGSIGSELCRQIATYNPKTLIVLDIYENNAYDLQNELLRKYQDLNLKVLIASVRDKTRIDEILEEERPEIIFHAAAHKHVPLMEFNPKAAIKNNIFGTLNIVKSANKYKVDKFVMISTDKAVNPTNVMGATKRICEMIIQAFNKISDTDYVAVRFGNVLGSNGSVIPLFQRQIKEGGPVTVTDERIVRFFMTIPEACQLVLEAGSMAKGGEIFILDMGQAVKILDLAKDLIRLSGFEPDVDIKIEITGLRPGEKLYEEILLDKEKMDETCHKKIYVEKSINFEYDDIVGYLEMLKASLKGNSKEDIRKVIKNILPNYCPYVPKTPVKEAKEKKEYKDLAFEKNIS